MSLKLLWIQLEHKAIWNYIKFISAISTLFFIRQSKRAHVYESAVTREAPVDPVAVKAVRRSTSFINPLAFFRKPEAAKDNSRIYYIYSNPLPVGVKEEEEEGIKVPQRPEEQTALSLPLSFQEYVSDPNSGVILDPPIFYMQL